MSAEDSLLKQKWQYLIYRCQLLRLRYEHWRYRRAVRQRKAAEKERKRIEARCEGVDELPLSTTLYEIARGLYFHIKWWF